MRIWGRFVMRPPLLFLAWASIAPLVCLAQDVQLTMTPTPPDVLWGRLETLPESNEERAAKLAELFADAGCEQPEEEEAGGGRPPNVLCTLPGRTEDLILVGAHFDKVRAGRGALDNWSGASMLASLYEAIAREERTHTFRFIGFTGEEEGLIGSKRHARRYGKKKEPPPQAMINIDTIGGSETAVWVSRADEGLARGLLTVAGALKSPLHGVDVERVGSTDSESFRAKKIPVITVHSVTQELFAKLHGEEDQLSLVRREWYEESYRLVVAYLIYLDQVWPPREAPAEK